MYRQDSSPSIHANTLSSCSRDWLDLKNCISLSSFFLSFFPPAHPSPSSSVPAGSPSHSGDVAVYVFDINQPSLLTPFYSVLVTVSVFMVLSTVFHSINSPDNSPLPYSVLLILILPYGFFQLCISLGKSPSALIYSFVVDWA